MIYMIYCTYSGPEVTSEPLKMWSRETGEVGELDSENSSTNSAPCIYMAVNAGQRNSDSGCRNPHHQAL